MGHPIQTAEDKGQSYSLRPIAILSCAAFCVAACLRVTDPLLPRIAAEFGVTTGVAAVTVMAFAVS